MAPTSALRALAKLAGLTATRMGADFVGGDSWVVAICGDDFKARVAGKDGLYSTVGTAKSLRGGLDIARLNV